MRWSSYFIAKERKRISLHPNRFKPITFMSVDKDTISKNKNSSKYLDSCIRRRDLCLDCTYSMPFGFVSTRFQVNPNHKPHKMTNT